MSALGQKPTFALQNVMSASPPIATSIAYFGVSALGQQWTLFDHLVGAIKQRRRQRTHRELSEEASTQDDAALAFVTSPKMLSAVAAAPSHATPFTHMARIDISVLTVLRPMLVVGKTWALAWMRIVAKARALPRRRENRLPHR
jgi:hypothetical protein